MNRVKQLLKGSGFRVASFLVQIFITFFMMPFIIRTLGDRMYGLWVIIATFVGYYGLLDLGLSTAVERYLAKAIGTKDKISIDIIINTSFFIYMIMGLLVLFVSFIVAKGSVLFFSDQTDVLLFQKAVLILGVNMAVGMPARTFKGMLTSHLRHDIVAVIGTGKIIFTNLLIYILLKNGYGIIGIAMITLTTSLLEYGIWGRCSFAIVKAEAIHYKRFSSDCAKKLLQYAAKTVIGQIADILRGRIAPFIIGAFLNLGMIMYYIVAKRLIDTYSLFIQNIMGGVRPVFSRFVGSNDYLRLKKRFINITRMSVILNLFIGGNLIFFGEKFIYLWMGPDFLLSYNLLLIIVVPSIIALIQNPGISILYATGKQHYFAIANICEGGMNLALSIILVQYYGIYGIAIASAAEMTLFKLFVQPVMVCKVIRMPIYEYVIYGVLIPMSKATLFFVLYFFLIRDVVTFSYASLAVWGLIEVVLFVPYAYTFILTREERDILYRSTQDNC